MLFFPPGPTYSDHSVLCNWIPPIGSATWSHVPFPRSPVLWGTVFVSTVTWSQTSWRKEELWETSIHLFLFRFLNFFLKSQKCQMAGKKTIVNSCKKSAPQFWHNSSVVLCIFLLGNTLNILLKVHPKEVHLVCKMTGLEHWAAHLKRGTLGFI